MLTSPVGRKSRTRLLRDGHQPASRRPRRGHGAARRAFPRARRQDADRAGRLRRRGARARRRWSAWCTASPGCADLDACAPREQAAPVAERILRALARTPIPKPRRGPARARPGRVGNTGSRLLNWLVHAPLILSGVDKVVALAHAARDRARPPAGSTATSTSAEDGVAEIAAWCAIVAAGLLLPDGEPRRLFGEAGLVRALGDWSATTAACCRARPLAQIEAIALLVKLRACYHATRRDLPRSDRDDARRCSCRRCSALTPRRRRARQLAGRLGDRRRARSHALVEATGVRTRPLRRRGTGAISASSPARRMLQFDAAPPPLPRQARYGCASTLAFELSSTASGSSSIAAARPARAGIVPVAPRAGRCAPPPPIRRWCSDDANSTAILIDGGLGRGVGEVDVDRRDAGRRSGGAATRLEASHDGYAARYGFIHRRILILRDDGTRAARRGPAACRPGARASAARSASRSASTSARTSRSRLRKTARARGLALPDGSYWQFRAGVGEVGDRGQPVGRWRGRPAPDPATRGQGMVSRGGGNFAWLLKKMG